MISFLKLIVYVFLYRNYVEMGAEDEAEVEAVDDRSAEAPPGPASGLRGDIASYAASMGTEDAPTPPSRAPAPAQVL